MAKDTLVIRQLKMDTESANEQSGAEASSPVNTNVSFLFDSDRRIRDTTTLLFARGTRAIKHISRQFCMLASISAVVVVVVIVSMTTTMGKSVSQSQQVAVKQVATGHKCRRNKRDGYLRWISLSLCLSGCCRQ